jgi:hypothetical protein
MNEQEYLGRPIEKIAMRTPTRQTCIYTHRYRPFPTPLLIMLCIPIFFYQLVPSFTEATDNAVNTFASRFLYQPLCTTDIGDAQCCNLYLDAVPCQDECRKQHVDRETLRLTWEYEACADECLARYNNACTRMEGDISSPRSTATNT